MKKLFLVLILSLNSAFATEFFTDQTIETFSSKSYKLEKTFNISVLSVQQTLFNSFHDATLIMNGVTKTVASKMISRTEMDGEAVYTYEAVIKEDILADGFSCEENEVITYRLRFVLIEDVSDPHSVARINENKLILTHNYSWDLCHDFDPLLRVIEYTKL